MSLAKGDQQRQVKTQQELKRGSIKIRALGATNYYALDSDVKSSLNNNNILVLPPVSQTHRESNKYADTNKETKHLPIPKNPEPVFDSNSQSNIQSNIVESPNLKKAISKYSEVPETLDLNKDMSQLTKVKAILF